MEVSLFSPGCLGESAPPQGQAESASWLGLRATRLDLQGGQGC